MRLPILLWIRAREDALFYQAEVQAGTGYPQSNVAEELTRFVAAGMVSKLDRGSGSGRQYYLRDDSSPLWAIVDAAQSATTAGRTRPVR